MVTESKISLTLLFEENTFLKAQLELWKSRALALEKQHLDSKNIDVKKDLLQRIIRTTNSEKVFKRCMKELTAIAESEAEEYVVINEVEKRRNTYMCPVCDERTVAVERDVIGHNGYDRDNIVVYESYCCLCGCPG
jgi:uncharacterized protein with PIN domain